MSENKVLVTEKCGTLGRVVHYRKDRGNKLILQLRLLSYESQAARHFKYSPRLAF